MDLECQRGWLIAGGKNNSLKSLETGMVTYGATGRSGRLFLMGSAMVTDLAVMTTRPREICKPGVEER